jgi:hypothetical protein
MSFRPSYPDVSVGHGFRYVATSGAAFSHPVLVQLHAKVAEYHKANGIPFSNDEFDDNVCKNTPNIVCTEGIRGAGDLLHVVFNPIGKAMDAVLGTNMGGCGGCYQRQNKLNK